MYGFKRLLDKSAALVTPHICSDIYDIPWVRPNCSINIFKATFSGNDNLDGCG
jgi:hypothetical protein